MNLGGVALERARFTEAASTYQASVSAMERLTAAEPNNVEYLQLMQNALAYHADALDRAGQINQAIQQRQRQLGLLAPYLAQDRPHATLRLHAMTANLHLSLLRFMHGETGTALDHAAEAVRIGNGLVALEPANADWRARSVSVLLSQGELLQRAGRIAEAEAAAREGCDRANWLVARDPTVVFWRDGLRHCLWLRAELTMSAGAREESVALAQQALDGVRSDAGERARDWFALGQTQKLVGDMLWLAGDRAEARAAWKAGLAAWPKGIAETPRQLAARGEMLRGIGQRAEGQRIASQLAVKGYRQSLSNRARI
jgi:tetratricopeptide (TPR) repeat protein